ncbi:hypothetical protein BKA66DRAFT_103969 [Pyrenochaeta sp. MPI-SDFR-AT-0127]|nr:hypothetical protein BKA66DRAFT_103969 [Pyrenochaeta sp. MPI-SDFR-AT-0127]
MLSSSSIAPLTFPLLVFLRDARDRHDKERNLNLRSMLLGGAEAESVVLAAERSRCGEMDASLLVRHCMKSTLACICISRYSVPLRLRCC